jgi:predicted RND superfamily exporter protein
MSDNKHLEHLHSSHGKTLNWLFKHSRLVLVVVALLVSCLAILAPQFRLDASAESLVIEGDQDYQRYLEIREKYGSDNFLIVMWSPPEDLFSPSSLKYLQGLHNSLTQLPAVDSVTSILNVPLLQSPPVTYRTLEESDHYLLDDDTDLAMAEKELTQGPLYPNLLINETATLTAVVANLNSSENAEEMAASIAAVRLVLSQHSGFGELHLGGVPMVAVDMLDFVSHDISTFGTVVALFMIVLLWISFGNWRWVLSVMILCVSSTAAALGLLTAMDWPLTVVSSNFIALALIISLSLGVHIVVRYREVAQADSGLSQEEMLHIAFSSKWKASLFTSLTTAVAFASLLISGIQPVIDFGLMMVCALLIALVLSFTLFPALLAQFRLPTTATEVKRRGPADWLLGKTLTVSNWPAKRVIVAVALLAMLAIKGIASLQVENRFIDYFRSDTEIYKGMLLLDQELGGTTPLDVIITAPDEWLDEVGEASGGGFSADSYWYNEYEIQRVSKVHAWLESLPETGKVLSLSTTFELLTQLNSNQPLDNFALAVIYKRMPDQIKDQLVSPYLSTDGNELRFSIRVKDSVDGLNRQALLAHIKKTVPSVAEVEPSQVSLSGMLVLYNNVLQSLFSSQIKTLGIVFAAITLMFALLFRSPALAMVSIVPTLLAALTILGLMGWLAVPLNIMTITIAALTIGIGVDDTIHYVHRYQAELAQGHNLQQAISNTHREVGRAIIFTSVTISLGFAVLVLSAFTPSVYFGIFTGTAMLFALCANLIVLPVLLKLIYKPVA